MSLLKPKKKCKSCKKDILKKLAIKAIGAASFCSMACFYTKKKNTPSRIPPKPLKRRLERTFNPTPDYPLTQVLKTPKLTFKPSKGSLKKPKIERSQDYMAYIRTLPCLACGITGETINAHHIYSEALSLKCSDFLTIPICYIHHVGGNDAIHKIGTKNFCVKFNLHLYKQISQLLIKYITR